MSDTPLLGAIDFKNLVARHRAYFLSGATRSCQWRETSYSP